MNNIMAGWLGEKATSVGLLQGLDPRRYQLLDDLYIPNWRGGTAQIDHVIVSQFGLFIIETKNRSGLICGAPDESYWRQICHGNTYHFQNPMAQNNEHIRALARLLNLRWTAFHSIIFFCGEARFAQRMPFHVRTEGITTVVHSKNVVILSTDEVAGVSRVLEASKQRGRGLEARHVHYVNTLPRLPAAFAKP